ncbi:hypothetical protein [Nesterenkonia flava]|uniref:Uncharacterized protein n=1 Tax=Nesterenkonia flava TaxID=469799 RepID=A0ABU1FWA3_9MICC|nr:hypothetical protein [Nesterenkonia flava]MDR5712947.1 hypothetical protein [Nesterenkonia flava]
MNQRYKVRRATSGFRTLFRLTTWDVYDANGKWLGWTDDWDCAVRGAHKLSTLDQIRDAKHAELFPNPARVDPEWEQIKASYRAESVAARTDYALTN